MHPQTASLTDHSPCIAQVSQQAQPNFLLAGPAVRQLAILMSNPLLLEPQYHKRVLLPLLSLIAALPRPCAALLERWWSQLSATQLQQLIAVLQQFLSVRLYHTQVLLHPSPPPPPPPSPSNPHPNPPPHPHPPPHSHPHP